MFRRLALHAALIAAPTAASGQGAVDLPALIECRADIAAWNELAFGLMMEPDTAAGLGWTAVESANPLLQEYTLAEAISVFGRETDRIALTATGPMAVLDDVPASELASGLGIAASVSTSEKFLGEKVVLEQTEESDGLRTTLRVALNVSTVDTHPGKTLAGCSYALVVE